MSGKKTRYTVAQFRTETFICSEHIPAGANRFRRFSIETERGFDAYAAHDALCEFLKGRGRVSVDVNEETGHTVIHKAERSFEGVISKLYL